MTSLPRILDLRHALEGAIVGQEKLLDRLLIGLLTGATSWSRVCPAWPRPPR